MENYMDCFRTATHLHVYQEVKRYVEPPASPLTSTSSPFLSQLATCTDHHQYPFESPYDTKHDIWPRIASADGEKKSEIISTRKRRPIKAAKKRVIKSKLHLENPKEIDDEDERRRIEKAIKSRQYRERMKTERETCWKCNFRKTGLTPLTTEFLERLANTEGLQEALEQAIKNGRKVKVDIKFGNVDE